MRYKIIHARDRSEIEQMSFGDDCWHLVDTYNDETVWSDGMEPEDAILPRDLSPLVDLLNAAFAEGVKYGVSIVE